MARLARSIALGYPHQVTQRGNYEQVVFEEDADYRRYLDWLRLYARRYALDIWAYCLMTNHVHYVCVPRADGALARTFNTLHTQYSQYFHRKKGLSGRLWRSRFLSCILDPTSVFEEARFIETNPVRAGLVVRAEDYPWSSARSRVLGEPDPVLAAGFPLMAAISDWRAYLADRGDEPIIRRTRQNLKTGRPAGDNGFVREMEEMTGRRLGALPRGRPRSRNG